MVKLYYAFPVDWLAFMNHYLVASVSFGLIQLSSLNYTTNYLTVALCGVFIPLFT